MHSYLLRASLYKETIFINRDNDYEQNVNLKMKI